MYDNMLVSRRETERLDRSRSHHILSQEEVHKLKTFLDFWIRMLVSSYHKYQIRKSRNNRKILQSIHFYPVFIDIEFFLEMFAKDHPKTFLF
jgi:hypothetical protein